MRKVALILLSFVTIAVALSTVDDGHQKTTGFQHGPAHRPDFLDKVSKRAREAFTEIEFDEEMSRTEILEAELEWAREHGIEDEVREYQLARQSFFRNHHNKVDEAVKALPETLVKMRSYFRDHSLSHAERAKALHRLFKSLSPELRALVQSTRPSMVDKLATSEYFPAHKLRKARKEAMLKENE
ncbi:hypothetical protein PFISCL1PPCAC_14197, partial [Pristionchus fissidentatus]